MIAAAQQPDGYLYTLLPTLKEPRQAVHQPEGQPRAVLRRPPDRSRRGAPRRRPASARCSTSRSSSPTSSTRTFGAGQAARRRRARGDRARAVQAGRRDGRGEIPQARRVLRPTSAAAATQPQAVRRRTTRTTSRSTQCDEVVGHAVRQMYLLCAVADMALRGDDDLHPGDDRMWDDMIERKMYVTGGVGAKHEGEAFGDAFELPNESAYAETCAGIGNALWNHRMNLLTGDGEVRRRRRAGDVQRLPLRRRRFAATSSSTSTRSPAAASTTACRGSTAPAARRTSCATWRPCRSARTRFPTTGDTIYVNLYAAGEANVTLPKGKVRIKQETRYPWDGERAAHRRRRQPVDAEAARSRSGAKATVTIDG